MFVIFVYLFFMFKHRYCCLSELIMLFKNSAFEKFYNVGIFAPQNLLDSILNSISKWYYAIYYSNIKQLKNKIKALNKNL